MQLSELNHSKKIEDFILSPAVATGHSLFQERHRSLRRDARVIYSESLLPYLKLSLQVFNHRKMLDEALSLLPFFVPHRTDGYGWKGLTLFGISHAHTELLTDYGIPETNENIQKYCSFTDICQKLCPETMQFLKEKIGYTGFTRIRYMLVEPGGYISPHRDQEKLGFGSLNIVLSQPERCHFYVEEGGEIPLQPGDAFLFANGYRHCVINNSDQPRIHMLIHGKTDSNFWDPLLVNSFEQQIAFWEKKVVANKVKTLRPSLDNGFCAQPWSGLMLSPEQDVKPCPAFKHSLGKLEDFVKEDQVIASEKMKNLRQKIRTVGLPKECQSCAEEEKETGDSPRLFSPGMPSFGDPDSEIHHLEKVDIFWGRESNSLSLLSSPNHFSIWNQYGEELKARGIINDCFVNTVREKSLSIEQIDQLIPKLSSTKELILRGGEPLYYKNAVYFLNKWSERENGGLLVLNTNGQLITKDILNILRRIPHSLIKLNIDSVGSNYEWITGHSWSCMLDILNELKESELNVTICPAISLLNLESFEDFHTLFTKLGIRIQAVKTATPLSCLSIKNLPIEMKKNFISKNKYILEEYPSLYRHLQNVKNIEDWNQYEAYLRFVEYFSLERGQFSSEKINNPCAIEFK